MSLPTFFNTRRTLQALITSLLLLFVSTLLSSADHSLAEELILEQEALLSTISPRPTGEELKAHPIYPELVRRVSLIEHNWAHQKKGSKDAAKSPLMIVRPSNPSDVEKAYLSLLQTELKFNVIPLPRELDQEASAFYAFGFNSQQLESVVKKFSETKLRSLILKSAVSLGYESTSSSSLLFVPWRFSETPQPTIRGLKIIPNK